MKHFGNQFDKLIREKNIVQKDFAEKIGVSAVIVSKWKDKKSIDAARLESVSKALNTPITYWFDDCCQVAQSIANSENCAASVYGNATSGSIDDKDKEIAHLKEIIAEKERTIQILLSR